jgi:hypothetical protein
MDSEERHENGLEGKVALFLVSLWEKSVPGAVMEAQTLAGGAVKRFLGYSSSSGEGGKASSEVQREGSSDWRNELLRSQRRF